MNPTPQFPVTLRVSSQKQPVPNPLLAHHRFPRGVGCACRGCLLDHVSVHEPDRQENRRPGQTKIAGKPAALRIVVRDRVSGMPVKGRGCVEPVGQSRPAIQTRAFQTDASASIADPIQVPGAAARGVSIDRDSTPSWAAIILSRSRSPKIRARSPFFRQTDLSARPDDPPSHVASSMAERKAVHQ